MSVTPWDLDCLRIWAEHGLPDDQSTREASRKIMGKLLAHFEEMDALVAELTDVIGRQASTEEMV